MKLCREAGGSQSLETVVRSKACQFRRPQVNLGREEFGELLKKVLEPAGLMTSIIRAGTSPAFHIACISLRGLVMSPRHQVRPHGHRIESESFLGDKCPDSPPGVEELWDGRQPSLKWQW